MNETSSCKSLLSERKEKYRKSLVRLAPLPLLQRYISIAGGVTLIQFCFVISCRKRALLRMIEQLD